MSLSHFTVTQVRTAATCPRIHYFDLEHARRNQLARPTHTLVWLTGTRAKVAGGALFHSVVDRFHRKASRAPEVLAAIENAQGDVELKEWLLRYVNENCIDLDRFAARTVALRQAFIASLHGYFAELASIINYAVSNQVTPADTVEQLFGDSRRRVDVTFHVGEGDEAHVTGTIDYVFYDWRFPGYRIVDYKLTPYEHANRDLFQVCSYALMHNAQHGTTPAVALFYLHPKRLTVDMSWKRVFEERAKVYNLISSMVGWSEFDESGGKGLKPPGDVTWCASCKWNKAGQCEQRLGPKNEGHRDARWRELTANEPPSEPKVSAQPSPTLEDAIEELQQVEADIEDLDVAGEGADATDTPEPKTGASHFIVTPPGPASDPGEGGLGGTKDPRVEPGARKGGEVAGIGSQLYLGTYEATGKPVLLDPSLINTHIAVVGAAGSGKTWTAKIIAEEAIAAGVPVIAVDPQGDLVQFMRVRDEFGLDEREHERQSLYHSRVEPRIFTPGTSHGIRLSLNPIRLALAEDLARITNPARRKEEEETVLNAVASNLVALGRVGGEEDAQRTFLYLLLEAMPRGKAVDLADVVAAIMNPEALGMDEPDLVIKKGDREKLGRKLNAFVRGPAKSLFAGGVPLDLESLVRPSASGRVPLNVIYLNALTDDDQKHFFLAALAAEIYRWMVTSLDATSGTPKLLFYLDEARDFIPAGGRKPPAKEPLIRLFTQGRKYGVGCLLCTQSPRSVDYNVFGNSSTKIVGRMEAAQDVDRIVEWFTLTGQTPSWVKERKGAPKGTFVGRWPGITASEEGSVFKGRVLYSAHEGAWSPDRVEREVDAAGMRGGAGDGGMG